MINLKLNRNLGIIGALVIILSIGGFGVYEWLVKDVINASAILFACIGVSYLFNSLTWSDMKGKYEAEKDELEKYVTLKSSKISYYVLLVCMLVVLVWSERAIALHEIKNLPLVLVIGLAFVIHPLTEYFVSRSYQKK